MAKRLKTSLDDYGYPKVDNKIKTKRAPLIGFEWEIPCDWEKFNDKYEDYERDYEDFYVPRFERWAVNNGFTYHSECGCWEFASPVTNTISVARRTAKHLKEFAKRVDFLSMSDLYGNSGGIHVSVSKPIGDPYTSDHFERIFYMLNRTSSASFIEKFSGRGLLATNSYYYQCQASMWDTTGYSRFSNEMLKENIGRIEYRLWCNLPEFLIPAIEFTHSTFLFTRDKNHIPTLKEYKDWLFKQKGYKSLKNFEHADWSLIND